MSDVMTPIPGTSEQHTQHGPWPTTSLGRWAIGVTIVCMLCAIALPVVTIVFRGTSEFVDSAFMPIMAIVLVDAAAVMNVLAVWRGHERSAVSLLALVVTVAIGGFFTLMVVGEAVSGV